MPSYVLLRDLAPDKQTPEWLGKEIVELKKQAEKEGCDVIVGVYLENEEYRLG